MRLELSFRYIFVYKFCGSLSLPNTNYTAVIGPEKLPSKQLKSFTFAF
jgi:hypothetical protein